jgi:uncharacterized protein GlcG (DUF336 family)
MIAAEGGANVQQLMPGRLSRETPQARSPCTQSFRSQSDHHGKERIMRRLITVILSFVLTVVVVLTGRSAGPVAAEGSPLAPLTTQDLSLAQAQAVLSASLAAAEEQGTLMDIAVVDAGGNLKAFARMDGAWLGSIDIATTKARTARYFDLPTEELGKLSQPGGPLYQIETSNGGLITFPGGLPLHAADGTVIGAVGVSGSTVENDRAVAEAGVAAVEGTADASGLANLPAIFDQKSGGGGPSGGVNGDRTAGEEIPQQR